MYAYTQDELRKTKEAVLENVWHFILAELKLRTSDKSQVSISCSVMAEVFLYRGHFVVPKLTAFTSGVSSQKKRGEGDIFNKQCGKEERETLAI